MIRSDQRVLRGSLVRLPELRDGFEQRFESDVLLAVNLIKQAVVEWRQFGIGFEACAGAGHRLARLCDVAVLPQ